MCPAVIAGQRDARCLWWPMGYPRAGVDATATVTPQPDKILTATTKGTGDEETAGTDRGHSREETRRMKRPQGTRRARGRAGQRTVGGDRTVGETARARRPHGRGDHGAAALLSEWAAIGVGPPVRMGRGDRGRGDRTGEETARAGRPHGRGDRTGGETARCGGLSEWAAVLALHALLSEWAARSAGRPHGRGDRTEKRLGKPLITSWISLRFGEIINGRE